MKTSCVTNQYTPATKENFYRVESEIDVTYDVLENFYQNYPMLQVEQIITNQAKQNKIQAIEIKNQLQMVLDQQIMVNKQKKIEEKCKTNKVQSIQAPKKNNGLTKKSQYTKQMMSILQDYKDNQLIGKLAHFINKYNNKIQFNKQNVKSIQQFLLKNNEDTPKMDLFINIFMEVSHHKDNGMLYMFNSLNNINKFLKFLIEQPEYREKYLDVVNRKLISIYTKCSNKKVPQLKDLQDVITLKSYQKNLKNLLESGAVASINHLAYYLKTYPKKFPNYLKRMLKYKNMILKILSLRSDSVQVQDFQIYLKNDCKKHSNQIYEFVTENLISRNQKSRLDAILKTKSSEKMGQDNIPMAPSNKFTLLSHGPKDQQKNQVLKQQESIIETQNCSQNKTSIESQPVTELIQQQQQAIDYQNVQYQHLQYIIFENSEERDIIFEDNYELAQDFLSEDAKE